MKNLIIFLIFLIILFSCKKESEKYNIKIELKTTMIECFPNDSISLTFSIIPNDGKFPYMCTWINPNTFSGFGPLTINLKDNLLININVTDANNAMTYFQYEIKKDTIDSLKYDYRNSFVGFYDCKVICNSVDFDTWNTITTTYQDTLEILKNENFTRLSLSGAPMPTSVVDFNYNDMTFDGYHTDGKLRNDSIFMYTYLTPAGVANYEYKGIKIK